MLVIPVLPPQKKTSNSSLILNDSCSSVWYRFYQFANVVDINVVDTMRSSADLEVRSDYWDVCAGVSPFGPDSPTDSVLNSNLRT